MLMVGSLKLHPLDLLARMAPLAVFQCIIYAFMFGEFDKLPSFMARNPIDDTLSLIFNSVYTKLALNGILAFFLNWVSFTANKKTSALSMTVAGNVKQAFSIILAVYIFNTVVTATNAWGIIVTLAGGAWYSALSLQKSQNNSKALLPVHSEEAKEGLLLNTDTKQS